MIFDFLSFLIVICCFSYVYLHPLTFKHFLLSKATFCLHFSSTTLSNIRTTTIAILSHILICKKRNTMKNYSILFICLWAFVMHLAIASEQGQENTAKQKAQPQTKQDISPIARLQNKMASESIIHNKYSQTSPTDCDFTELEEKIMLYYENKSGYKITQHQVIPIEKKVSDQSIYYYGFYEVRGSNNGKPFGPMRKLYLISCHKTRDNGWHTDLELWDYTTAEAPRTQDSYFF